MAHVLYNDLSLAVDFRKFVRVWLMTWDFNALHTQHLNVDILDKV